MRTASGLLGALLVLALSHLAFSVEGDTLWVRVTLYDYRADATNPDINNLDCATSGRTPGMVQPSLSADGKPVFKQDLCCNVHLNDWYRPSGGPGAGYNDSTHRWSGLVPYKGRGGEYVGADFSLTDSMANVVIYDSLPFVRAEILSPGVYSEGTYIYTNQAFFRVDNRGFVAGGDESSLGPYANCCGASSPTASEGGNSAHNFGFTMEMHSRFTYLGGEYLEFVGDDDLWVFVNGRLALDLGGIHLRQAGSFFLDDLADGLGLVKGEPCRLDIFYAERMTPMSTIKLTTNIIVACGYDFDLDYPQTVQAGDTAAITASLVDCFGNDFASDVEWQIVDDTVSGDKLLDVTGKETGFAGEKAHRSVTIQATYWIDQAAGRKLVATTEIEVVPGPIDKLRIEDANYNPMPDTITLDFAQSDNVNLYSTAYDRLGNRIGRVPSIWTRDGTLHALGDGDSTSSIFYDSKNAISHEAGDIVAVSVANPSAYDYIYIYVPVSGSIAWRERTADTWARLVLRQGKCLRVVRVPLGAWQGDTEARLFTTSGREIARTVVPAGATAALWLPRTARGVFLLRMQSGREIRTFAPITIP